MVTQPPAEKNNSLNRGGRADQFNRRTILILLAVLVVILAFTSLLPGASSRADSILPERAENHGSASLGRVALRREKSGPALHTRNVSASVPESSAASIPVAPPPLQSGGTQFVVDFDELAPFTDVSTRYPRVVFSSPGHTVFAGVFSDFPSSGLMVAAPWGFTLAGTADFIVTFPIPVNNLFFAVVGSDKIGTVALLDLYQNGSGNPTVVNQRIQASGFAPIPMNFSSFTNVSKVVVHHVDDVLGIGYDSFSFTVPAATPTPTPTPTPNPTPPPAPTNLTALPDVESIDLQWTASPGATSYIIKRTNNPIGNAASVKLSATAAAVASDGNTFNVLTVLTTNATSFHDDTATDPNVRYDYVVAAVGLGGIGPDSNIRGAIPDPKYACSGGSIPPLQGVRNTSGGGWSMKYQFSEDDGLVLTDIFLNGRKMAAKISVPYFKLDSYITGQNSSPKRGELRPNGSNPDGTMRSKLIFFHVPPFTGSNFDGLHFRIIYAIDKIPNTPKACITVSQHYSFLPMGSSLTRPADWPGPCEPSEALKECAKFRTKVEYNFSGKSNEKVRSMNVVQRHFYDVQKENGVFGGVNRVGLFQDRNSRFWSIANADGFADRRNPLTYEIWSQAIIDGQPGRQGPPPAEFPLMQFNGSHFDNLHQTYKPSVKEPDVKINFGGSSTLPIPIVRLGAGCPECVHVHWRWGAFFPYQPFGGGYPLLFPKPAGGSTQSLDIAVNRSGNNDDPQDYKDGLSFTQFNTADQPVLWYSATSKDKNEDKLLWHTGFFYPRDNVASASALAFVDQASASTVTFSNGPTSIDLGDVYKAGNSHIEQFDLSALPPLPAGYVSLSGGGYNITTDAVSAGPATIEFTATSITTEADFNNVRIFHVEPDPFDPTVAVWVDSTVLAPDSPAPNFSSKAVTSRTEDLGVFVLAKRETLVPPSPDRVNLVVNTSDSPDPVVSGHNLTYTITVSNSGPQAAHSVAVRDDLDPNVAIVSATSSQGNCKWTDEAAYCTLGTLNVGSSATVTVVVSPRHNFEQYTVDNKVTVRAREIDNDESNNSIQSQTTVSRDLNAPPTIALTAPATNLLLTGPATVQVTATAIDSDGSISKVEIVDGNTLLGTATPTGNNNYVFTASLAACVPHHEEPEPEPHDHDGEVPCGGHALMAVATDNGGRQTISAAAYIFVNGPATVQIVNPADGLLLSTGSSLTLIANASRAGGSIAKVEFFANDLKIGDGTFSGGQYTFSLTNLGPGSYTFVAVATDDTGVPSRSAPLLVRVGALPQVSVASPIEGSIFPSGSNITVSAIATSSTELVAKVDFYANGVLIGSDVGVGNDRFLVTWRQVPDGQYTLTAVATDSVGLTTTSQTVNIGVNATPTRPGVTVWFDEALPQSAVKHAEGDVDWYWVDANPGAFSGTKSHQSRNFKQVTSNPIHLHGFDGATAKLHTIATDVLFTHVFLDINNMPRQLMLEFKDANGWDHRAYWGSGSIPSSTARFMGPLPRPGRWTRLEVKAGLIGLNGTNGNDLDGMRFILDGGRATFDYTGKAALFYPELTSSLTPPGDTVWINGAVPPGATQQVNDDVWEWINCSVAVKCHQSISPPFSQSGGKFRQHFFTGGPPQYINSGDVLFTQVLIDPAFKPDQIVIQWHDGASWHRAYWGNHFQTIGIEGTETWRYMGGLPADLTWTRLEVPASYVGLEGKSVSGMSFGFYRQTDNGQVIWGRSGKTGAASTVVPVLSSMTGVSQFFHRDFGYYYSTKNIPLHSADRQDGIKFYVHPNQAAGTVPFYRFINTDSNKREFFYSKIQASPNLNVWKPDGIAFYVYPDASTPGVVTLNLFHEIANPNHYHLSTADSVSGMVKDGPWAHVYPANNSLVPTRPYFLAADPDGCRINWLDSSNNETGFRIEQSHLVCVDFENGGSFCYLTWSQTAVVGPNITQYNLCTGGEEAAAEQEANGSEGDQTAASGPNVNDNEPSANPFITFDHRVVAFNAVGDSEPSNGIWAPNGKICRGCIWVDFLQVGEAVGSAPQSITPTVDIASPLEGQVVSKELSVVANAFDKDGNGTLAKVELFDGPTKVGELTGPAPYSVIWNNATNGSHVLTVKVTDASGVSAMSAPVNITVTGAPSVTITSPSSGTIVTAPGSVTLQATASDPEGSVAKVEFYQGTEKLGEDTIAPYSFAWNSIQAGSYTVTARVIDSAGLTATSTGVPIMVNSPPTVELTSAATGQVMAAPGAALLVANVSDSDSAITKVDFYQGTTLIGTSTTFPYTFDWTSIPGGNYNVTAKATDSHGAVTMSAAINVIVNSAPSVSITSPMHKAMLTPWSNVVINASATDPDGTITQVEFYQGTSLIGTDTASPYSVTLNNIASGSYVLTAKATDNRGVVTTSAAAAITTPVFFDDFNDNSLNSTKWSVSAPTSSAVVTEQDQQLRITLPPSTATYNGIVSNATHDMGGAAVQVEVAQAVSQAGWVENMLKVEKDALNYFLIDTGAGNLLFRSTVNGTNDQLIISFDSTAHRYWRIRHNQSSNAVTFETSPDAITWTTQKTVTTGFSLSSTRFSLIAGAYGTGNAAPGAAIYNDFQYIPSVAAVLSDDFNDNSIDTSKWTTTELFSGFTDTALPVNETSERFEVGPLLQNTGNSHYRGLKSVNTYDFTGGAASVELVQAASSSTEGDAHLTIGTNSDNYYRLYVSGGNLFGLKRIGGTKTTLFTISYDAVSHRYLRIRHDAATNTMILETAPSAGSGPGTWTHQYNQLWSSSVVLTTTLFEVKGGTWQAEANAPGKVIFDNFLFTRIIQVQAPTLSSVSPTSGPAAGGTALMLTGTQFVTGATVSVGGVSATNVSVTSSTSITATAPAHASGQVSVTVTNPDGGSATLVNGYTYNSPTNVLLEDDFNDNSINSSKWNTTELFSGFTDTSLAVTETSQRFEIGPLLQNTSDSHYRGLRSVNTYDFTGGAAYVELVQAASAATQGDAMLTIGNNGDNYYRLYVSGGNLFGLKRIGGTKTTLFTISYDAVNHRYLRIRHSAGTMIMETAPSNGSGPGAWTQQYNQVWSSSVALTTMLFEVKGGTWQVEANAAGKVIFDNFSATK